MAGIIIADAGPLIALASVERLSLFKDLFSTVQITSSVRDESLAKPCKDAEHIQLAIKQGWLVVMPGDEDSGPLSPALGAGESDSIRLALQTPNEALLVMDDRLARRYANARKLSFIGTVRLLDLAEQQGVIDNAEAVIKEMSENGYRISVALLDRVRKE